MSSSKVPQNSLPVENAVNGSAIGHSPELDLSQFRINQDFAAHIQARKVAISVNVRRPDRQQWVCPLPGREWRAPVAILEDKANQRTYIVVPEIVPEVTADLVPKLLVAYVTTQGAASLWPIRMPDESGRLDTYNESALQIIEQYGGRWIRVLPNQVERRYDVLEMAATELPAPKWPEGGFTKLFSLAFRGRVIDNLNHPVLKTLRGESL